MNTFSLIVVYDGSLSDFSTPIYIYDTNQPSLSIAHSLSTGKIFFAGTRLGNEYTIESPTEDGLCHPNCDGGCSIAFSPSHCDSCSSASELSNGMCVLLSPSLPPTGEQDVGPEAWSESDVKKAEESEGYKEMALRYLAIAFEYLKIGFEYSK
jgi:hypothetical protein